MTNESVFDLVVINCQVVKSAPDILLRQKGLENLWKALLDNLETTEKTLSRSQQRRRNDIIQAALKVFDQQGFDAAKMDEIAKEADVAKGTLYLYFDTKVALLEGVVQDAIMPTLQQIDSAADGHEGSAKDLLKHQIRIAAMRMASPEMKTLLRHMISGGPTHQRLIEFYYQKVVRRGVELFRRTLDYGVETGEFRPQARNIDPLVLVGAHVYAAVWNILFDELDVLEIDKLVEDHVEVVLNGLTKHQ